MMAAPLAGAEASKDFTMGWRWDEPVRIGSRCVSTRSFGNPGSCSGKGHCKPTQYPMNDGVLEMCMAESQLDLWLKACNSLPQDPSEWEEKEKNPYTCERLLLMYDDTAKRIEPGYPKSIKEDWGGVGNNLDAAFRWSDGKSYFFRGDEYWRYNDKTNKVDFGYPKVIEKDWPGVPSNLDAVFRWSDDRTYFFKGDKYWGYDDEANKVDSGYPKSIKENWRGVSDNLNAVYRRSDGLTYFFKGDQFWRYNDQLNAFTDPY
ncbi:hypothetical protein BSKO_09720 [Bryopsis sp. KO-2023]|nr:hypothetical protein BSKO_09720 [Bryopsis sp. KO-2023]